MNNTSNVNKTRGLFAVGLGHERKVYVVINGRARLHAIVVPAWQAMAVRSAAEAFRRERTTVVQS